MFAAMMVTCSIVKIPFEPTMKFCFASSNLGGFWLAYLFSEI